MASSITADASQRQTHPEGIELEERRPENDQAPSLATSEPQVAPNAGAINPSTFEEEHDLNAKSADNLCIEEDNLNFRPLVLKPWFLWSCVVFNFGVLGLLVALYIKPSFSLLNEWAYFFLQIFPIVIGTVTTAGLEAIITALSRVTPFMRCVRPEGDLAKTSIMLPYVPLLGPLDSFSSGNWHLVWANGILWLGYPVLGLKSALLTASLVDGTAEVTDWALHALLAAYTIITVFIIAVLIELSGKPTGLRNEWDTVNIADHLVLFRQSNFLDCFEGSCIATRKSMSDRLEGKRLRLGYWSPVGTQNGTRGGTEYNSDNGAQRGAQHGRQDITKRQWYGFKEVGSDYTPLPQPTIHNIPPPATGENPKGQFTALELSMLRFNSAFFMVKPLPVILSTVVAAVILVGYTTALALGIGQDDDNTFSLPVSPAMSAFLLNFLLTFILSLYSLFWEDMYLFTAITEPYVAMNKSGGADAEAALLLNYISSPRIIAMFDAAARGHWKVFRTALFAMLQRLLPIIAGASISVLGYGSEGSTFTSTIQFSTPLTVFVIIYLVAYLLLIPYEVFESAYTRYLPRDSLTIADLLSWTCSSRILREDTIHLEPDQQDAKLPDSNPLDTRSDSPHNKRWYMEARLRLAQQAFSFGLERITGKTDSYSMGINTSTATTLYRPSQGLRRRVAGIKKGENRIENPNALYRIAGSERFQVVNRSEEHANVGGSGGQPVLEGGGRGGTEAEAEGEQEGV